jgi:MerR family transcriptional regulator, light-induced transcriptional regulator
VIGEGDALSLQEAADRLGVHYMTAYRYVRLGLLPASKEGSSWRVAAADLDRLAGPDGLASKGRGRQDPAPWAARLEHRLVAGDEVGAWGVVEAALAAGAGAQAIYLSVLAPAMTAIGEAWAAGEVDVSIEHRASAIALRLIGRLGPRFARRGVSRGSVLLAAPQGDLHGLPVALAADLVRGAGFDAEDLGADLPAEHLVAAACRSQRLVAVAVAATTPHNGRAVQQAVRSLQAALHGVPVLVGGGAVPDEAAARRLGADGWGRDGAALVELLESLPSSS